MALQVWLPLINDTHNQGLREITVTNNGATVDTGGIIGGCYVIGSGKYLSANLDMNSPEWSITAWFFSDGNSYNGTAYLVSLHSSNSAADFYGGIEVDSSTSFIARLTNTKYTFGTITTGVWHHLAVTYKDNVVYGYVDGSLMASKSVTGGVTSASTKMEIARRYGQTAYYTSGKINDIRVYDHCLSAKEIKEISKGLVLNYKLNETYGMTNLFAGKTFNVYNNYGTGMTCVQEDIGEAYMGQPVRRFTYTIVNSSCASGFKSGYGSRGVYVGQCYFGASGTSIPFVYWIYYRPQTSGLTAGGTASNIGGWSQIPSEYVGDGWYRVGQYRRGNSSTARTSDNVFTSLNWPYAGIGSSCTIDFTVAGYLISGTTEIPGNFVEGNSEVHDCSGYGNDGRLSSGALAVTNNSGRYCSAVYSSGDTMYSITSSTLTFNADKFTVSIWRKPNDTTSNSTNSSRIDLYFGRSGYRCFRMFTYVNYPYFYTSGDTVNTYLYTNYWTDNKWHMMTGVYDGANSILYIDGVEVKRTAKVIPASTGNSLTIQTRNEAISDFRIYGTALSPEDVLELYHTPASIDNHGNFYCGEIKEV